MLDAPPEQGLGGKTFISFLGSRRRLAFLNTRRYGYNVWTIRVNMNSPNSEDEQKNEYVAPRNTRSRLTLTVLMGHTHHMLQWNASL